MQKIHKTTVKTSVTTKPRPCLCHSLKFVHALSLLVGVNTATYRHEGGICVFRRSIFWSIWSGILVILLIMNFSFYMEFGALTNIYALPVLLNGVTDLIYYLYLVAFIILSNWRTTKYIKVMNDLSKLSKLNLPCDSAMDTVRKLVIAFCLFYIFILVSYVGILSYLHYSESYETEFSIPFVIGKLLQNGVLMFYVYMFSIIAVFIGVLTCFEGQSLNALKYTEIYPMKRIRPSNNTQDIFVFFTYKVCKSDHVPSPDLFKLSTSELVEYFRILHEEISEIMYVLNDCLNPVLLIHVVIEIIMLVINWYSVIIRMAYDFDFPEVDTIFVLNFVFAISHSIGLFVFLRNAQKLSNMVHGYSSFLMEYSTRVSSSADHLQLRVFIEKIKQHKPLTASGIFTINLGIAGPIFANILTYVLVALQFKIPRAES